MEYGRSTECYSTIRMFSDAPKHAAIVIKNYAGYWKQWNMLHTCHVVRVGELQNNQNCTRLMMAQLGTLLS